MMEETLGFMVRVAFIRTTQCLSDTRFRRYEQHEGAKVRPIQESPNQDPLTAFSTELLLSDGWPKRKG